MTTETELREKLAACTRIFAMQEMLGLFGHISVFDPKEKRVYMSPAMGFDKASVTADDIVVGDLTGKAFSASQRFALEWPIHMALHSSRDDAIAVAHLHAPYATAFSVSKQAFRPITLQGTYFARGVPIYHEPQLITTMDMGRNMAKAMGDHPAIFLKGHGIALAARSIEEMLYGSLILEDEATKHAMAGSLGEFHCFGVEDAEKFGGAVKFAERGVRCWNYYCKLEHRWDRNPGTGKVPFS
jgi:ribulose-5-phosphate 4-epimerase/fuculose-1-phosphate aldolase